ncbi:hypothetical protein EN35_24260 [Rhodococcus qingshengii]|nr:hypothetical protein EN35_24260 [Rhodococcus qingshengii]OFE08435.1 hypothetical protein A5N83_12690 [Rhodococcus sp. 1139]
MAEVEPEIRIYQGVEPLSHADNLCLGRYRIVQEERPTQHRAVSDRLDVESDDGVGSGWRYGSINASNMKRAGGGWLRRLVATCCTARA